PLRFHLFPVAYQPVPPLDGPSARIGMPFLSRATKLQSIPHSTANITDSSSSPPRYTITHAAIPPNSAAAEGSLLAHRHTRRDARGRRTTPEMSTTPRTPRENQALMNKLK